MATATALTCDYVTYIDRPGERPRIGRCGLPARRRFRVSPEARRDGAVQVRSTNGIQARCREHSPLSRRNLRFVFLPFGIVGFRADTEPPADPIGWSCRRAMGWVRPANGDRR
jgi:hypothetical protein